MSRVLGLVLMAAMLVPAGAVAQEDAEIIPDLTFCEVVADNPLTCEVLLQYRGERDVGVTDAELCTLIADDAVRCLERLEILADMGVVAESRWQAPALNAVEGQDATAAVEEPDLPAPAQELRQGRTLVAPGVTPPVTIEAFEDPQCPACGLFTERIEPLIIAEYVEQGTASFTYNDFVFLGDESWDAAIAMRVAEDMDGKFWDYHQALFHNQSGENAGGFTRERLADIAVLVGLDREEFLRLMDDDSYRAAVEAEVATGQELSVNSTPTLIVNGEIVRGVPEWEDLDAIVRAAAEAASQGG